MRRATIIGFWLISGCSDPADVRVDLPYTTRTVVDSLEFAARSEFRTIEALVVPHVKVTNLSHSLRIVSLGSGCNFVWAFRANGTKVYDSSTTGRPCFAGSLDAAIQPGEEFEFGLSGIPATEIRSGRGKYRFVVVAFPRLARGSAAVRLEPLQAGELTL